MSNVFYIIMYDAHHEKTYLKIFVVVIPKEVWALIFFWYDTCYDIVISNFSEFDSADIIDYIL